MELFQGEILNRNILGKINDKGKCFGEIGFITGLPRTASAISNGITVLVTLERSKFIEILRSSPKDYVIQL